MAITTSVTTAVTTVGCNTRMSQAKPEISVPRAIACSDGIRRVRRLTTIVQAGSPSRIGDQQQFGIGFRIDVIVNVERQG